MSVHRIHAITRSSLTLGCALLTTGVVRGQELYAEASKDDEEETFQTADETRHVPYPPPKAPLWYGWQTLATSGVGAVAFSTCMWLTLAGEKLPESAYYSSISLYLGGGPLVHWAHGEIGKGFGSFSINVVFPFSAFMLGGLVLPIMESATTGGCYIPIGGENLSHQRDCTSNQALPFLITAGFLAAPLLDATLLAYESPAPSGYSFSLAPLIIGNRHDRAELVGATATWVISP